MSKTGGVIASQRRFPIPLGPAITMTNWWIADAGATLSGAACTDGGLCDSWADRVGALAMTGATTQRPIFRATSSNFNGHACIEFDGSNDRLFVNNTPASNAQPNTVFCVFKMLALPASGVLASITDNDSGSRHAIYAHGTTPEFRGYAGTVVASGIGANTNLHLAIFDANGASSTLQLDGTTSSAFNANSQSLKGFYVGAAPGAGGTQPANVQIAFVGWLDGAMSSGDKTTLRSWAQSYYGTP